MEQVSNELIKRLKLEKVVTYDEFTLWLEFKFLRPFKKWRKTPCLLTWKVSFIEHIYVMRLFKDKQDLSETIALRGFDDSDLQNLERIIACQGIIRPGESGRLEKTISMNLTDVALFYLILNEKISTLDFNIMTSTEQTFFIYLRGKVLPEFNSLITKSTSDLYENYAFIVRLRTVLIKLEKEAAKEFFTLLREYFPEPFMICRRTKE